MELLIIIGGIAIIGFAFYSSLQKNQSTAEQPLKKPQQNAQDSGLKHALDVMSDVIAKCTSDHANAVYALAYMAGSDGKISRQELRIIIGFCERMGTATGKDWERSCEYLNSGISMEVTGGLKGAQDNITNLSQRSVGYRAAFLGAAEAIVASNRTSNASKRKLLDQARAMI